MKLKDILDEGIFTSIIKKLGAVDDDSTPDLDKLKKARNALVKLSKEKITINGKEASFDEMLDNLFKSTR